MKALLFSAACFIVIQILLLFTAAMGDLLLLGFRTFTVTCFAVAGVFSAIFCYAAMPKKESSFTMMLLLSVCAVLFFIVAPLSGSEYNLPVKSFAVTEAVTTFFLKYIFHNEYKKS